MTALFVLATSPAVRGATVGTAQVETFAILGGSFMALMVLVLFWLRSGHERARREVVGAAQRAREESRERSRVLEAHEPPPRHGEDVPR